MGRTRVRAAGQGGQGPTTRIEDVAVAAGDDDGGAGAVALEGRVGRNRRAVPEADDPALVDAEAVESGNDALGLVVGCARGPEDAQLARRAVVEDDIGERAADVDADPVHEPPRFRPRPGGPSLVQQQCSTRRLARAIALVGRRGGLAAAGTECNRFAADARAASRASPGRS
jgi:hypothetical protein